MTMSFMPQRQFLFCNKVIFVPHLSNFQAFFPQLINFCSPFMVDREDHF